MDLHSREQYLERVREEYRRADKKAKTRLLSEARQRTRLNRKVLIRKLAHPVQAGKRPKRRGRGRRYGAEVVSALTKLWEMFEYPCGQRLAPAVRTQLERLRAAGELRCSDEVAEKLGGISPRTIDRLLVRERQVRGLRQNRNPGVHSLLRQQIPVKVAADWDTRQVGNLQVDYVEHGGRSAAGEYLHTLSVVDIASGWWEPEAITSRSQQATREALDRIRQRLPFRILEIHPDNDGGLLNEQVWRYCREAGIRMSRSRPYKKNDNAWVEQRNWTHVRKVVGYRRLDTTRQLAILRELYGQLRLYKNYFQPVMKLREKVRIGGRLQRKYEPAQTPYQRLLDSGQLKPAARRRLEREYEQLNVAELHRRLEQLRDELFATLEESSQRGMPKPVRKGVPLSGLGGRAHAIWMRRMLAGS